MSDIFISYRRDDCPDSAGRIYDRLKGHFGEESVFFDIDTVPFGLDFREHVDMVVSKCDIVLVVIGDKWLRLDDQGKSRLENPADFVRIEVETALKRDIPVIPVPVENASIPSYGKLPKAISDLSYRNAAEVRSGTAFQGHIQRLIRGIERILETKQEHELQQEKDRQAGDERKKRSKKKRRRAKAKPKVNNEKRRLAQEDANLQAEDEKRRLQEVSLENLSAMYFKGESPQLLISLLDELGRTSGAKTLARKLDSLRVIEATPVTTRSLVVGATGIGKTTLVNALAHFALGLSATGGAQSAAPLTLSYRAAGYQATVTYRNWSELSELTSIANTADRKLDLSRRPDQQIQGETLTASLLPLFATETLPQDASVVRESASPRAREAIDVGRSVIDFENHDLGGLIDHVHEHTNTGKHLWAITKDVAVAGPFAGLDGATEIVDLPGIGDLNLLRTESALHAIQSAAQLIVVVGDRGITNEVAELLANSKILSFLMTAPEVPRIMFVGTKLDGAPTTEELNRLGLESSSLSDVVNRRFDSWRDLAASQWQQLLNAWSKRTLGVSKGLAHVKKIVANTAFMPCTPLGFLCEAGLEKDLMGTYEKLLSGNTTEIRQENTNVLQIREVLRVRHKEGQEKKLAKLRTLHRAFSISALGHCDRALQQLASEHQRSTEYADAVLSQVARACSDASEIKTLSHSPTKDDSKALYAKVHELFSNAWKDIDKLMLVRALREEYGQVNFQTLMAALRRRGVYEGKGKAAVIINIPSSIGVYAAEPAAAFLIEDVLPTITQLLSQRLLSEFRNRSKRVLRVISELGEKHPESGEGVLKSTERILDAAEAGLHNRVVETVQSVHLEPYRRGMIEEVYFCMGLGMQDIMLTAEEAAKGPYARDVAIVELATLMSRKKKSLISRIVQHIEESVLDLIVRAGNDANDLTQTEFVETMSEIGNVVSDSDSKISAARLTEIKDRLETINSEIASFTRRGSSA